MKFEVLKRNNLKRNIIIGVFIVSIISTIVLSFTKAKYRTTQSIPLVNGTINYSLADLNIIGLYINGEEATELDDNTNYILDTTKSTCTSKDGSAIDNLNLSYDSNTKTFTISPYTTKGTKCALYFDELILAKDTILANYSTVLTRDDFATTITDTTTGTIYISKDSSQYDDFGEVYYFAGNPTDNWVKFAGFYWRIIRINGDGTIRMIYQGTSPYETGTETQIGTSTFNNDYNDNMYVGYMYTNGLVHGLGTSSTIKEVLDNWYQNNLISYASRIDDNAGFCGDRISYTSSDGSEIGGGIGTSATTYNGNIRLYAKKTPTFKCEDFNDLYTTKASDNGNKALIFPLALITADEMIFAGGSVSETNETYYLYNNEEYWTITPSLFSGYQNFAVVFFSHNNGRVSYMLDWVGVGISRGVRPVINLKASVTISSGNGTSSNPYIIS